MKKCISVFLTLCIMIVPIVLSSRNYNRKIYCSKILYGHPSCPQKFDFHKTF